MDLPGTESLTEKKDETRASIEEKVKENGGEYVGDLSKRVTHLIVNKPEGKKYLAARKWQIRTVSIEWLNQSIERGMILHEELYDPTLPQENRGKGAWIRRDLKRASLGKRSRDGSAVLLVDDGRRKLRKTASMKFTSQGENVWGDIVRQSSTNLSNLSNLPKGGSVPPLVSAADQITPVVETPQPPQPDNDVQQVEGGVFSRCCFYVYGFPTIKQEIVEHHISSHDGQITHALEDAIELMRNKPKDQHYLVVPQTSQPESHPDLLEGMHIVTEFYIERCVHNKTLFTPNDHVLGQPFAKFPIDRFSQLTICTSGFRNEQLNQVEKTITQLGAAYSERLNPQCSLLVCPSLDGVRKQKLDFARLSNIPVVNADWLWECIMSSCLKPWDEFLFKELSQETATQPKAPEKKPKDALARSKSESALRKEPKSKPAALPAMKNGIDMTAFEDDTPMPQETMPDAMPDAMPDTMPLDTMIKEIAPQETTLQRQESGESNYETAPTHQPDVMDTDPPPAISAPLSEMTQNALNKSPSPQKTNLSPRKLKRFPTGGEIGDSESGEELDDPADGLEDDNGASNEEAKRKREAERVKKAQREEMSKRLNSLMGGDGNVQASDSLKPQPAPRQQRRRREILGRAASNVSTASSASVESRTSSKSNLKRTESIASRLDSAQSAPAALGLLDGMMQHNGDGNETKENGDAPPPATQLEYDNPEAREYRAAVLERMTAGSGKPSQKVSASSSSTAAPLPSRRSRRR